MLVYLIKINQCFTIYLWLSALRKRQSITLHSSMSKFTIPDPRDTRDVIADYLALWQIGSSVRHEQIIKNCLIPITLLFEAGEMVSAAGPEEEAVFAYFLSMLHAQAQPPHANLLPHDAYATRGQTGTAQALLLRHHK